jgi:mersacidin/lichenicidin family type 2 lantibiotic
MAYREITRVWKGKEYRLNFSQAEETLLPYRQDGLVELTDAELADVGGGISFVYEPKIVRIVLEDV